MKKIYNNLYEYIEIGNNKTARPMDTQKQEFHLHDSYEVYYLIYGDVNYFVEKTSYRLEYGDLLIMNSNEVHKPSFLSNKLYDRIVIHLSPQFLKYFSTDNFDLAKCFTNRNNGENNRIPLTEKEKEQVYEMLMRIISLDKSSPESTILRFSRYLEFFVFINNIFLNAKTKNDIIELPQKLLPIINYIDCNLSSDLSLDTLEKIFFIDKFYLSRLFKEYVGSTIHEYIIYKRISIAKKHLLDGCSARNASTLSGFNDYSNFHKMFKRITGMTPMNYKKNKHFV